MTPMPPSRARPMAVRASVTVSIAAETIGISSSIVPRQARAGGDVARKHPRLGGHEEHVVEGESFLGELALQGEEALDLVLTQLDAQLGAIVPSCSDADELALALLRHALELLELDERGQAAGLARVEAARRRPRATDAAPAATAARTASSKGLPLTRAARKPASSVSPAPTPETGSILGASARTRTSARSSRSSA